MDTTNIYITDPVETEIDPFTMEKMVLLYNALENGWAAEKARHSGEDAYIFTKKHEGKKEVFLPSYLKGFMEEGFDIKNILD